MAPRKRGPQAGHLWASARLSTRSRKRPAPRRTGIQTAVDHRAHGCRHPAVRDVIGVEIAPVHAHSSAAGRCYPALPGHGDVRADRCGLHGPPCSSAADVCDTVPVKGRPATRAKSARGRAYRPRAVRTTLRSARARRSLRRETARRRLAPSATPPSRVRTRTGSATRPAWPDRLGSCRCPQAGADGRSNGAVGFCSDRRFVQARQSRRR